MTSRKATAKWFEYRSPVWREVAGELELIERGKLAPPDSVLALIRSYPEIARDLAIARREAPDGSLTKYLERVYLNVHRVIFRPPGSVLRDVRQLFISEAAEIAHSLRAHILWVTTLFVTGILSGWWLVASFPDLASLFASEEMIERVRSGRLWTEGLLNVMPSSLLSVQIFTNNVVVSLMAVAVGVLYGLGTFYIILNNGVMIGAIFAFTGHYDMAGRLFDFVSAHGFVELSAICISGAVGASLGEALVRPGHLTRAAAFQQASRRGLRLMVVVLGFLVVAGIIEGFVSPRADIPFAMKLAVGLCFWIVFLFVLTGGLSRIRSFRKRASA